MIVYNLSCDFEYCVQREQSLWWLNGDRVWRTEQGRRGDHSTIQKFWGAERSRKKLPVYKWDTEFPLPHYHVPRLGLRQLWCLVFYSWNYTMGQVQVVATAFVCFFFLFALGILFMSHFTGTNKDMGSREDAGALLTKLHRVPPDTAKSN